MPRVLMNFQLRRTWAVHFLESDCRTVLGPGRFYDYSTLELVRQILIRANASPATHAEFDSSIRQWSRGSVYLELSEDQYGRLKL